MSTLKVEIMATLCRQRPSKIMGADVNAQGGRYGNALQVAAASFEDHYQVVQMLLDKGVGVNAQGGLYGNALQAASS